MCCTNRPFGKQSVSLFQGEHIERMRGFLKFQASDLAPARDASHDGASSGATMNKTDLSQLATLITQKHDELLAHWRQEVRLPLSRSISTLQPLTIHIPDLLEELACELEAA
jgi:hypothetical protein